MSRKNKNEKKNDFRGNNSASNYRTPISEKGCATRGKSKNNNKRFDDVEMKANKVINNAAWYIKDPELRKQVASYSMNSVIGMPVKLRYNQQVYPGIDHDPYSLNVPSVLAMECNPSPGYTPDSESGRLQNVAINKAARQIYASISSVNAKTTQYQPQDLIFAILSVGEIISMVSHLTRMYGVAFNFSKRNRDIPNSLLTALKVEPKSLMDNLSHFRMRLNSILVVANQITMFSNIPYFDKCWDMYSSIYTDSTSGMSQLYVTVPYSTWILDEKSEGGSTLNTLELMHLNGTLLTASEWLDVLEEMVDTLLTSSTYNYIYTDIMNYISKKGGSLYSFGYVSEMYRVTPMYNLEYLLQIHNATTVGIPSNNDVQQSVAYNSIVFNPTISSRPAVYFMDKVVDFPHTSDPTDDDKINAIMYHGLLSAGSKDGNNYEVADMVIPDHYPVIFTIVISDERFQTTGYRDTAASLYDKHIGDLSRFDWAPLLYTTDSTGLASSIVGDLNFYDAAPYNMIADTFDFAYLGLFTLDEGK